MTYQEISFLTGVTFVEALILDQAYELANKPPTPENLIWSGLDLVAGLAIVLATLRIFKPRKTTV